MTIMDEVRAAYAAETVRWLEDVAGWMGGDRPPEDSGVIMMICHALERGYERARAKTDTADSRAAWLLKLCGYRPRRDDLDGDPLRTPPRV